MQQLITVVKFLLLASIATLLLAIGANLVLGVRSGFLSLFVSLASGIFAFWMMSIARLGQVACPVCGTLQPQWRRPNSLRQTFWGGWTCARCGTEMDRDGNAIERNT